MPKLKTRKSIAKRFHVTKNKKVLKRKNGQNHFNSRESGKVTKNKRRDVKLNNTDTRNVRQTIPYC